MMMMMAQGGSRYESDPVKDAQGKVLPNGIRVVRLEDSGISTNISVG